MSLFWSDDDTIQLLNYVRLNIFPHLFLANLSQKLMSPAHCECQHATTCHSARRARSSKHWSVATPILSRLSTPFASLALCQCGEVHPYITAIYHRLPWRIVLGISEVAVQTISPQGHIPAFHSPVHLSAPNLSPSSASGSTCRFTATSHSKTK